MKRLLTLLLLVALTSAWARADLGGFTLRHVNIDAVVHENSTWDVTETLDVEFFESRHGIYKYIPSRFFYGFENPDGTREEKIYKNIIKNVKVDGHDYSVDEDDSAAENTIIKIGSASSYVDGKQTYVISYQIQYLDDRCDTEDFLCHTIWGSGWNTPVDEMEFKIKFDKPLPDDALNNLYLYSGQRGTTYNADSVELYYDDATHTLSGYAANMNPNDAITISAKLPQGFWKAESKNMFLFYTFLALTVACAVMFLYKIFSYRRRDPIPVVSFYPPDGMSSAEVGKIIDDSTDPEDLASLIPWFAHRGFITIKEIPDKKGRGGTFADLELTKKIPLTPDAPKYQRLFMDAIFDGKHKVIISELGDRHSEIDAATKSLDAVYSGNKKLTDFGWGTGYWFLMLLAAVGVYWTGHVTDLFDMDLAMFSAFSTVGAALLIGIVRQVNAPKRAIRSAWAKICEAIGCAFLMALGLGIHILVIGEGDMCVPYMSVLAGGTLLSLLSYLSDRAVYDTEYRTQVMGELLGLRDFIQTAEMPKLKMLVDEDPEYFYNVLPFAMVFGLSDKWADLFKDIKIETPDWYYPVAGHSYATSSLMAQAISANVSHSIKDAVAQASVDPTSSSSSGGYSGGGGSFSGGGGGGGGGGSW